MKAALRIAAVAVILGTTYLAIVRVAEHKVAAHGGAEAFRLAGSSTAEARAFEALLVQLRRWDEDALASSLLALEERGELWVAPDLAGQRSAIYVSALSLVSRIYVRRGELVGGELPFPDLDVPEWAQREFATIRLAGTLFHELQHYEGLEDEGATYDREIDWYRGLRERALFGLEGERERWLEWAIDSAIQSALSARDRATAPPGADAAS